VRNFNQKPITENFEFIPLISKMFNPLLIVITIVHESFIEQRNIDGFPNNHKQNYLFEVTASKVKKKFLG